ncbi:hypothetical protein ACQCSS_22420 [Ralstonia pseudosolanacearum]|uniref:hypothetical protein n=1 Tax=Ralstonia pseudosolanacearum TaxID=1310165 RepID=UPI003CEE9C98
MTTLAILSPSIKSALENKMRIPKYHLKKFFFATATTAMALTAGTANSQTAILQRSVQLTVQNATSGCVRIYFNNAQYDVQSLRSTSFQAVSNFNIMASVFRGACGGTATRNVWSAPVAHRNSSLRRPAAQACGNWLFNRPGL